MATAMQLENEQTPKKPRLEEQDDSCSESEDDDSDLEEDIQKSRILFKDWPKFTTNQLAKVLQTTRFDQDVAQKFQEHDIDGSVLDRISEDDLKNDMGIDEKTCKDILKFLKQMGCYDLSSKHILGTKVFNDPVHGHMAFHPLCVAFIDTPQFQRLRDVKQLGACYHVFSGAGHNRFEHYLGVCHLAGQLLKAIQKRQPQLNITEEDVLCVQIAGLCYGLGYGPFSHVFSKFISKKQGRPWEHEEASVRMFQHMIETNDLKSKFKEYGFDAERDLQFIQEQIGVQRPEQSSKTGEWKCRGREVEKAFLYEIVANKRNGMDVDKWDAILRDCLHLGMRSSFDHTRFIHFARVIKVGDQMQVCVRDKEVFDMYELFHTRQAVDRRAYQHKVVISVETMIQEALELADEHLTFPGKNRELRKMSKSIEDMEAYMDVTDNVLHMIMRSVSKEPDMDRAKEILRNIQSRMLYKCVGESGPTKDKTEEELQIIRKEILEAVPEEQRKKLDLNEERIRVQLVTRDFGVEGKNPVDELRFYSKNDMEHAKPVKASEVSHMAVPQSQYKEQFVRLYLVPDKDKTLNDKRKKKLSKAFRKWYRPNKTQPNNETPTDLPAEGRNSEAAASAKRSLFK